MQNVHFCGIKCIKCAKKIKKLVFRAHKCLCLFSHNATHSTLPFLSSVLNNRELITVISAMIFKIHVTTYFLIGCSANNNNMYSISYMTTVTWLMHIHCDMVMWSLWLTCCWWFETSLLSWSWDPLQYEPHNHREQQIESHLRESGRESTSAPWFDFTFACNCLCLKWFPQNFRDLVMT